LVAFATLSVAVAAEAAAFDCGNANNGPRSSSVFNNDFLPDEPAFKFVMLRVGCGVVVGRRIALIAGVERAVWSSLEIEASTNLFGSMVVNLKK
jgi:hypothetical protein